ncbi:MAG: GIY-YIG nuclease family protein [Flavobacteriia bacterium]|nr:MAG: GIY-YIG nuclease family protein [Flavobacteriia bacterium]
MYYVYILYSPGFDTYYIGQTNELEKRLKRHNSGYVKSTKPYRPWEMVYYESFETRSAAMQREHKLKSWKSKEKLRELVAASR